MRYIVRVPSEKGIYHNGHYYSHGDVVDLPKNAKPSKYMQPMAKQEEPAQEEPSEPKKESTGGKAKDTGGKTEKE